MWACWVLWRWAVSLSQPSVPRGPEEVSRKDSSPDIFSPSLWDGSVRFHAYMGAFLTLEPQRGKVEYSFLVFLVPSSNRHTYHASWSAVTGEARAAQKWLAQQEAASAAPGLPTPLPPHTQLPLPPVVSPVSFPVISQIKAVNVLLENRQRFVAHTCVWDLLTQIVGGGNQNIYLDLQFKTFPNHCFKSFDLLIVI